MVCTWFDISISVTQIMWYMCLTPLMIFALPLHSLLVCQHRLDGLYWAHLILYAAFFLMRTVYHLIRALTESDHFEWRAFGTYLAFTTTFIVFSIPTRLLYIRTFQEAVQKGVDSTEVFQGLYKEWLWTTLFAFLMVVSQALWFTVSPTSFEPDLRSTSNHFWDAMIATFELRMYFKLDSSKNLCMFLMTPLEGALALIPMVLGGYALVTLFSKEQNPDVETAMYSIMSLRHVLMWPFAKKELMRVFKSSDFTITLANTVYFVNSGSEK